MLGKLTKWISDSFTRWLTYDHPYEGIPLCDFERIRYELRPCDVLLIEGRSRVSEIIRTITQSSWSHAALYIGRLHDIEDPKIRNLVSAHFKGPPDTQLLVEGIMGKGGLVSDINFYKKDHIRLCRPRGLSRQDAQQVISHAVRKLGHDYNVRHVVDLARFLLPWTLFPRRFRSQLFEYHPGDSTKTVCSTLIAEAFNHVEFPILPLVKRHDTKGIELIARNPKLYTPRDFDYSPYFEIIKYPFVEFADYATYRQLPWNREGLISHDRMGVHDGLHIEKPKKEKENPVIKPNSESAMLQTPHAGSRFHQITEHLLAQKLFRHLKPKDNMEENNKTKLSDQSEENSKTILEQDKTNLDYRSDKNTEKAKNHLHLEKIETSKSNENPINIDNINTDNNNEKKLEINHTNSKE